MTKPETYHWSQLVCDAGDETPTLNEGMEQLFGICGCSEMEPVKRLIRVLLEWAVQDVESRASYSTVFADEGVFYFVANVANNIGLLEHGSSIRCAWTSVYGRSLLADLQK